jgi:cytidylate kinase
MVRNPILDYISQRIRSDDALSAVNQTKVITISREYGCPGIPVAHEVAKALTQSNKVEWSVIDKQIVNQAAEEFDIPADLLEKISKSKPKGAFEELFVSFTDIHLPSDIKIKKTLARILRTVIMRGNAVILGRGGVVLSRDIEKSLHVQLHAPISWRVEKVKILENITSTTDALGRIKIKDSERTFLRNFFAGENLDENIFDVSLNCERLTQDQIIKTILKLAQLKGI